MKLIPRNNCVINENNDLETLFTFKSFPVFMGCTDDSISDDLSADMDWVISKTSGMIQLKNLIPLDILYHKSHNSGFIGKTWHEHHVSFSNFLKQFDITSVFEIGGSHAILAHEFQKTNDVKWTIIDPNPSPIKDSKVSFIKGFFDENLKYDDEFNTVIHSHLFEHMFDPNLFMSHLSEFISDGKYLVFSVPNMNKMLELNYTNCLNFEHTLFLTEPYVEFLLSKNGFKLIKKEYFLNNHSIFYCYIRDSKTSTIMLPDDLYLQNKTLFLNYINYHTNLVSELNLKIEETNKNVYLFGAHIFSQYLISFGLNSDKIISILDNDINKQGKRLYGTQLKINSPKILKNEKTPIVILKAGAYNEEIKLDILKNINENTIFFE